MNLRRRTRSRSVLLPWERRRAWLSGPVSGRRWRAALLSLALGLLALSALRVADRRARLRSTRATIAEVQRAIALFRGETGRCPRSTSELLHPPRAGAHYLLDVPVDGWGRDLYVRCPSPLDPNSAEVVSAGPSGSFADTDNVL